MTTTEQTKVLCVRVGQFFILPDGEKIEIKNGGNRNGSRY
jgi:hypothetical protein